VIASLIRLVTGVRARWLGCGPEDRQRVYFANHASNLDGPTIWAALPRELRGKTRPVAAQDYWTAGPIRRYLSSKVFRVVYISRQKITKSNNPLVSMCQALDGGDSLIIFPEGTRTMDAEGEMGVFRPGLHHLAERYPEVEFVPVYLENLNRILPKGEYLIVPVIAAVSFGEPIKVMEGESKQAYLKRAHDAVEGLALAEDGESAGEQVSGEAGGKTQVMDKPEESGEEAK
jgi:1-acyl-sn-glycerol-3-phosphate acyltransferase